MKLIRHLTWQNMKSSRARTLVTLMGIILSAAMFTAVTTMAVSIQSYMIRAEKAYNGDYFVRYDYSTAEDLRNIQKEDSVLSLGTMGTVGYTTMELTDECGTRQETYIIGAGNADFFKLIPAHLEEGRLPQNGSELVITRNAYHYLKENGLPCEVGSSVTLSVQTSFEDTEMELPSFGAPFDKTFTIVGISDIYQYFEDFDLHLSSMLTFDDGSEEVLWSRLFAKTSPRDAYALGEKDFGPVKRINQNLLNLYGISPYSNINDMIQGFAAVLCLIIMVGSVSLIYNAFSISVSERTRQFGLLSSVGATKKQLRKSVFAEAFFLSMAGIPLGILCGYGGISVTLHLTHGMIDDFLLEASENSIIMKAVPSVPAFVAAGIVALITVLISAWIPARRATKVTPISAIRQSQDYKVSKGSIRAGKLTQKIFGLPAALARKYYTVNRRKYRATVISLTISMVLFVSAGTFVQQIRAAASDQSSTDNFDFAIHFQSEEQLQQVRAHPALKDSAIIATDLARSLVPLENMTEEYRNSWNHVAQELPMAHDIQSKRIILQYLEDDKLQAFLVKQGLNPEDYMDPEHPAALVQPASFTFYERDDSGNRTERYHYSDQVLKDGVSSLTLIPDITPQGVLDQIDTGDAPGAASVSLSVENGIALLHIHVPVLSGDEVSYEDGPEYQVEIHPLEDGRTFEYYFRNPKTGEKEKEPAEVITSDHASLPVGSSISELPFGIRESTELDDISVILPLSAANRSQIIPTLAASTSDYNTFKAFLDEEKIEYTDYLADQIQQRNYITVIRIFSYGFITLISLICICNVFNTISTNIALRRKDFGMLRSVGMKNREINRMMSFECLQYGLKALLWGIPLSIICSFFISRVYALSRFLVPWQSMSIAAGCIFLIVFITMFYAVSKLRKQNPIDAIRSES